MMKFFYRLKDRTRHSAAAGFTLVELLVAIALFSILVAVATGGFVNALRTQRQVAALIAAQSNAGQALEQMAREVRTGYLFCHDTSGNPTCHDALGNICTAAGLTLDCSDLDFYNSQSANVVYSLGGGELVRAENGIPQPITGVNVAIRYLTFSIFGNTEGDHWNPRITIDMGVAPNSNDPALTNNVLDLQTTISARGIDCITGGGAGAC